MRFFFLFLILFLVDFLLLFSQISQLSIGYDEARILYEDHSWIHALIRWSIDNFGMNDYALRLPMILLHFFSVGMLYGVSGFYLNRMEDRLWLLLIYILLPGVVSAGLIVNDVGLLLAIMWSVAYIALQWPRVFPLIGVGLGWIHPYLGLINLAVLIYGMIFRDQRYLLLGGFGTLFFLYFQGFEVGGIPKGHFLDILAIDAAIFSPIVFLYLVYALYRRILTQKIDILLIISALSFLISILLSFRQRVEVHLFVPLLMVALPLMGETFIYSYRIRLCEFRYWYRWLLQGTVGLLILHAIILTGNRWIYTFLDKPSDHFAYSMHIAKELAQMLRMQKIACVDTQDPKMQLRLQFYGITQCNKHILKDQCGYCNNSVTICYNNREVYHKYVTNINK